MKHITLIIGLLVVGCLTPEQKQKALKDSVVGEYDWKPTTVNGRSLKDVYHKYLLANGIVEDYYNGAKQTQHSAQWSIVNGYIHVPYARGATQIWRINKDKSITKIAHIDYGNWGQPSSGKYKPIAKEQQATYKKIK